MSQATGLIEMRLAYFLEESGMSQSQLARVAGVSRQLVYTWLCKEGMWILCTEDFEVKRIERRITKRVWSGD
jgi:transcriptional regulator with XRE-family HTH domain